MVRECSHQPSRRKCSAHVVESGILCTRSRRRGPWRASALSATLRNPCAALARLAAPSRRPWHHRRRAPASGRRGKKSSTLTRARSAPRLVAPRSSSHSSTSYARVWQMGFDSKRRAQGKSSGGRPKKDKHFDGHCSLAPYPQCMIVGFADAYAARAARYCNSLCVIVSW